MRDGIVFLFRFNLSLVFVGISGVVAVRDGGLSEVFHQLRSAVKLLAVDSPALVARSAIHKGLLGGSALDIHEVSRFSLFLRREQS